MRQDMRTALKGKGDFDRALNCLEKILYIQKSSFGGYHKDICAKTLFKDLCDWTNWTGDRA